MTKELLEQEFKNGLWHKDIAKKYGVNPRTIYEYVKKWNLHIPRKNASQKLSPTQKCKRCGKLFSKLENGYCENCNKFLEKYKRDLQEIVSTNSELGKQIQGLRKQGLSYRQIQLQLGCSISTISYHCNQQTKNKVKVQSKKEIWKNKFLKQLGNFKRRHIGKGKPTKGKDWNHKIRSAVSRFQSNRLNKEIKIENMHFTYKKAIEHFGGTTTKCYLTGRAIDILKDDYCLDHIVPVSKGGSNQLSNMGITCPEANASKSDLTLEEYLNLCKEVLENFGYTITK